MHNRREQVLKLTCLVLGALLALQLVRFIIAGDPAKGLVIPPLPSLPPELEAQGMKGTNAPNLTNTAGLKGMVDKGTNKPALQVSLKTGTNGQKSESISQKGQSNSSAMLDGTMTNSGSQISVKNAETNPVGPQTKSRSESNSLLAVIDGEKKSESSLTNASLKTSSESTSAPVSILASAGKETNLTASPAGLRSATNSASLKAAVRTNAPPGGRMNMAGKTPELPSEIKERVDRIVQGEILGQVMRPMPMALLGIAGEHAFLRSADGQTGMIKEGDKLGSLKLLRIGINRVLIEQEGEKKELSIFAGLGSESMMPKEPPVKEKKTNEPAIKTP